MAEAGGAAGRAEPDPILVGRPGDAELTATLLSPLWTRQPGWGPLFAVSAAGSLGLFGLLGYTAWRGIGVWGNNIPVGWAFGIINFVWWIGIGHAGTFISAFLLLLGQHWRTSINRIAEAMTLFAVVNAGLFPLFHLGRPWFAYWLVPYPSRTQAWPQFRSALPWDFAAISTYFTVSLLFWYLGLVPDFASARDTAPTRARRRVYGVLALGWRGSGRHWHHYRIAYGLLAGLATPLVISVHSVVSLDFASTLLPGWHSTVFPPYFVAGAIFSGFAMVLTLMLPLRWAFRLHDVITPRHLDAIARLILVTGWIVAYSYLVEHFLAWYSGNRYEEYAMLVARPLGGYAAIYWVMVACNVLTPQVFWWRQARRSVPVLFAASILINVGMWSERFVIIVGSLYRDFLPSSWHMFHPTWVDVGIFAGTLSFFLALFLLFLRYVPVIPLSEVKELKHELVEEEGR